VRPHEPVDKSLLLAAAGHFLASIDEHTLNYILPEDLNRLLEQDPESIFLLDNRTPESFAAGHITGAVNIWLKDVLKPENAAKLPKDKTIVVVCWVGHTASQLLTVLQLLGYQAVGLKYGMGVPANPQERRMGWLDHDFPVELDGG
jgi:rhodanese-related sulfurtransferase